MVLAFAQQPIHFPELLVHHRQVGLRSSKGQHFALRTILIVIRQIRHQRIGQHGIGRPHLQDRQQWRIHRINKGLQSIVSLAQIFERLDLQRTVHPGPVRRVIRVIMLLNLMRDSIQILRDKINARILAI